MVGCWLCAKTDSWWRKNKGDYGHLWAILPPVTFGVDVAPPGDSFLPCYVHGICLGQLLYQVFASRHEALRSLL